MVRLALVLAAWLAGGAAHAVYDPYPWIAAAYARVSYARQLQGDLPGALRIMRMAADATSAHDPESLAWHHAHLGQLHLEMGQLADARREFLAAAHAFPEHPLARAGLARVAEAGGDVRTALDIVMAMLDTSPTPADLAYSGDLMAKLGQTDAAERQYRLAEAAWRTDAPEPSRLARFLAEHGRRLDEAIAIGEQARIDRNDIFTADALAWAYFQTGQIDKSKTMIALARRTGTRDRTIRAHAAAISGAAAPARQARR
jgi:tetratricopeptide (TPR) repeat protein